MELFYSSFIEEFRELYHFLCKSNGWKEKLEFLLKGGAEMQQLIEVIRHVLVGILTQTFTTWQHHSYRRHEMEVKLNSFLRASVA